MISAAANIDARVFDLVTAENAIDIRFLRTVAR